MLRINRGIDTKGAGKMRNVYIIAGFFSLLFLLITGAPAQAADCIACHGSGGGAPTPPHEITFCQDTSCALACHTNDLNRHSTGYGTPFTGERTTTCRNCHDKPFAGVYHPYKININAGSTTPAGTVDLDQSCGQCHGGGPDNTANPPAQGIPYYNKTYLGAYAKNIHFTRPDVQFAVSYDTSTPYKVDFNASLTTCPSGNCTYSWDFGDATTGSGVTASKVYADAAPRPVVLTVNDNTNHTSDSASQTVTPRFVNHPPVASFIWSIDAATWTVTVTDKSTDPENNIAAGGIRILWGDGTSTTGDRGGIFPHTYAAAGTFKITLRAIDTGNLLNEASGNVVLAAFTISGKVLLYEGASATLDDYVQIILRKGTTVVSSTYTNTTGDYSFANVKPGAYTVTAVKSGVVFASSTLNVNAGPSSTGNNFTLLKNKFKVTSTVLGSTGLPISGVMISVKNSANTLVAQGVTDAMGVYATGVTLPAGTYSVSAARTGRSFGTTTPQAVTLTNGGADGTAAFTSTTP
jgi:hypothetical protein